MNTVSNITLEKPNVISLLKMIKSGIAFDLAKRHIGISIWDGEDLKHYGFKLAEESKDDYFAMYRLRRELKKRISEITRGKHFEYCFVEDIYGGENFNTVRILAELNTVPDECIFDSIFTVDNFIRLKPVSWLANARTLYRQRCKLTTKIEIQGILEYFEDDFVLKNKDLSEVEKKNIFYEDICDATGMLLSIVAMKILEDKRTEARPVPISKIKFVYLEATEYSYSCKDKRVKNEDYRWVTLDYRNLEKSISSLCGCYPDEVLCALLPPKNLGNFGLRQGFEFYDSDEGFLFFYKK